MLALSALTIAAAAPPLFLGKARVPTAARQASAAVFRKADGALVRTLWHVRDVGAGTEVALEWDGQGDSHHHHNPSHNHHTAGDHPLNPDDFEFRLQTSNVSHEWQGVIGNSGPMTGPRVMRTLYGIQQIVTSGNVGIIALGYNEQGTNFKMFDLENPHSWTDLGHPDTFEAFPSAAFDGTNAYLGNLGICQPFERNVTGGGTVSECKGNFGKTARTFVTGLDMANSARFCDHNFGAAGQVVCAGNVGGCPKSDIQGDHSDGCNGVGRFYSSAVDVNCGNISATDPVDGRAHLIEGVTALAVDMNDRHACGQNCSLLFVTHRYLNETRVLDKVDGTLLNTIPMEDPVAIARNGYLWSIETVYTAAPSSSSSESSNVAGVGQRVVKRYRADTAARPNGTAPAPGSFKQINFTYGHPTTSTHATLPGVIDPISISAIPTMWSNPGSPPHAGGIIVADAGDSTVKVFNVTAQLVNTIGHPGGFTDGDPTVTANKFAWKGLDGKTAHTSVGADEFGGVWVADFHNRRILRFNYSTSETIGRPVAWASSSYVAASLNASRVFSNFLEYRVNLTQPGVRDPAYPLAESWMLVRNWAAHLGPGLRLDSSIDGIISVAEVGGRTFGLVRQADPPSGSRLPSSNVIVELDAAAGLQVRLVMNLSVVHGPAGYDSVALQPDASIIYMRRTAAGWDNVTQTFYRAPFDAGKTPPWTLPGELIASLNGRTDQLLSHTVMGPARYPINADGDLIIFDDSSGKNDTSPAPPGHPHDPPNQGFHLGALRTTLSTGGNSSVPTGVAAGPAGTWRWQASPWGAWGLIPGPPMQLGTELVHGTGSHGLKICEGYNVSEMIIDPDTADGRYGGNNTAVLYAGNIPMCVGLDVVYGYHGEFWESSEANQFVHFRNGQFVGQFGMPNHQPKLYCGSGKGTYRFDWALPGRAGNSFSPSLITGRTDDELFMDHNDESQHGGLHRWRISGLSTIAQHAVPLGKARRRR